LRQDDLAGLFCTETALVRRFNRGGEVAWSGPIWSC